MDHGYLKGRRVALGVGGGIAAYKACDLIRELQRAGATVRVATTTAALEFVTPLTLQSLSGHAVLTNYFDPGQERSFGHLQLSRWADLYVVAPATADLIARIRAGMANDAVTTSLLAFKGPVLLAPAMNTMMWDDARTQDNVKGLLAEARFHVVGPDVGPLADGDVGAGRLAELHKIVDAASKLAGSGPLAGKKVLVTAGPTREHLDPVRFLSNPSSGKMGLAVAAVARSLGAQVTVVLGPTAEKPPDDFEVVHVVSAQEMLDAVLSRVDAADYFVATAAVSDFKPAEVAKHKVKKSEAAGELKLVRTPDVLLTASQKVHAAKKRPVLVGFAAETQKVLEYAKQKLSDKKLDFIVANDVAEQGAGFGGDSNRVQVVAASGQVTEAQGDKREVARRIWDVVLGNKS